MYIEKNKKNDQLFKQLINKKKLLLFNGKCKFCLVE